MEVQRASSLHLPLMPRVWALERRTHHSGQTDSQSQIPPRIKVGSVQASQIQKPKYLVKGPSERLRMGRPLGRRAVRLRW